MSEHEAGPHLILKTRQQHGMSASVSRQLLRPVHSTEVPRHRPLVVRQQYPHIVDMESSWPNKSFIFSGGRGGNRTHNPRLRRPVLYPIELLARCTSIVTLNVARPERQDHLHGPTSTRISLSALRLLMLQTHSSNRSGAPARHPTILRMLRNKRWLRDHSHRPRVLA